MVSFHWLGPSRRSQSPDRPFLNPRASAFLFPRPSVSDTPSLDDPAAIDEAFPIPRPAPTRSRSRFPEPICPHSPESPSGSVGPSPQ